MNLSNIFAMMQQQNNDYHNRLVGMEGQILARQGVTTPGEANRRMDVPPLDTGHLSPQAQLAQARGLAGQTAQDFNHALSALTPKQQAAINRQAQALAAADKQNGVPPQDPAAYRSNAAMNYATDHLAAALKSGGPIDNNLNNVFTTGTRNQQAQFQLSWAQMMAHQQPAQQQ